MRRAVAPNAEQKRFHNFLAEHGCFECGAPAALHHAVGSTARHNKIHIGQWWVIPLCYDHHQGQGGIHGDLGAFIKWRGCTRKEIEKAAFSFYAEKYVTTMEDIPGEVIQAIADYRR